MGRAVLLSIQPKWCELIEECNQEWDANTRKKGDK